MTLNRLALPTQLINTISPAPAVEITTGNQTALRVDRDKNLAAVSYDSGDVVKFGPLSDELIDDLKGSLDRLKIHA